jgi:hypothetical protein
MRSPFSDELERPAQGGLYKKNTRGPYADSTQVEPDVSMRASGGSPRRKRCLDLSAFPSRLATIADAGPGATRR